MEIKSEWNKNSSNSSNNIFSSSSTTWYGKGIETCLVSLKLLEKEEIPIILSQKDFDNGTYRIKKSGLYKLSEDIIFNPNPSEFDSKTCKFLDDKDWMPTAEQSEDYPRNPFRLGFFAAITVEADNVIIDLNNKSISQSRAHYLQQRFYANIELANSPFIPKQGPADFGSSFFAPTNVKIKNGSLGFSSHHGIHGNSMKNVILENLSIYNFEIAGVALNGGYNVLLKDVEIYNTSKNVPVLATYSASRFIRPFLKMLLVSNESMILGGKSVNASILLNELEEEMNSVYKDFVINKNNEVSSSFYKNNKLISDGAVYGLLLNQNGVAVGDFIKERKNEEKNNENIFLDNLKISNLISSPLEVIGLSPEEMESSIDYGIKVQVGTVGEVLRIKDITNEDGTYKPNILSQVQLYLAKFMPNSGTLNITSAIYDTWAKNSDQDLKLIMEDNKISFVGRGDSMAHVMKGNIGLFISGTKNLHSRKIQIKNVQNLGSQSLNEYKDIYYEGNVCRGISIVCSENININGNLDKVFSKTSASIGVDIKGSCENINLNTEINQIETEQNNYPKPNYNSFIKKIEISPLASRVFIKNPNSLRK